MPSTTYDLFAACAPGLEAWLAEEVSDCLGRLGKAVPGGVELKGDLQDVMRLNLHLGLASSVLIRLARFEARHFSTLAKQLRKVRWDSWLSAGQPLSVRVTAHRSKLMHTKAIEQRVVEAVRASVPTADPSEGATELAVRMDADTCIVSLDTSGEPLHRRGYRLASAKAPLREDLARAVIRLSGWSDQTDFADPFCGSGTLGIEAARWARRIAPGIDRAFAFERWPHFDAEQWQSLRDEAEARILPAAPARLWLSDRDAGAVEAAQSNAARARVAEDLAVECAPMGRAKFLQAPPEVGAWVSNPPHGGRVGKKDKLRTLYQSLGPRLPKGWTLTLVVRDRRLARATAVPLDSRLMTSHGGSKIWIMGGPATPVEDEG